MVVDFERATKLPESRRQPPTSCAHNPEVSQSHSRLRCEQGGSVEGLADLRRGPGLHQPEQPPIRRALGRRRLPHLS
jgi:hypothetical protein